MDSTNTSDPGYRGLFESVRLGIVYQDADGRVTSANPAAERILGLTVEQMQGRTNVDPRWRAVHADGSPFPGDTHPAMVALRTGKPVESTTMGVFNSARGRTAWIDVSAVPLYRSGEERPYQVIATFLDITARKTLDDARAYLARAEWLTRDEDFFCALARFLAEHLEMDYVCIDRLDGDELTAHTLAVWCDGHLDPNVSYALKDTPCGDVVGKTVCSFASGVRHLFPNDAALQDLRAESYLGVTLWGSGGEPIGLIAVIGREPLEDPGLAESTLALVAVRAAAELERRQDEARFRSWFELPLAGICITSPTKGWLDVNQHLCTLLGYDRAELTKMTWAELTYPEDLTADVEQFERVLRGEIDGYSLEKRFVRKDGTVLPTNLAVRGVRSSDGSVDYFVAMLLDITDIRRNEAERARLEAQLQQAQRMESIGRLAGGVAHDFNNMLGVILGHVEMALEHVHPSETLYADLQEVRAAADRSASLTRQLLAFARRQTVVPRVVDLNETVSNVLAMLKRLIGEQIQLDWHPAPDLWPVRVDTSQLDQVLTNLCVNARDAIGGRGAITIETNNAAVDAGFCETHPHYQPGEFVRLSVRDDGTGMDEQTLAHIFEPFFTTKALGEGTGLGLAMVYGIVEQNAGFLDVTSEPGRGSVFSIFLPRHCSSMPAAAMQAAAPAAPKGAETILLVEDEPAVLSMTRLILERQGYTVLAAGSPGDALRLAAEYPAPIDLLLTDVVMPEMNGRELADRLLAARPALVPLFMSGYTSDLISKGGMVGDGVAFIQKPFSIGDITAKVRDVLAQRGAGAGPDAPA